MRDFDRVEIGAVRNISEADHFWKHQTRIIAARLDLPPVGIMERIRKATARLFWKEEVL